MKRLISIFLVLCLFTPAETATIMIRGPVRAPPAAGVVISDDFNRTDSDPLGTASGGGTWTEQRGDTDIFSNTARLATGFFTRILNVHSTSLGSVNGYIKVQFVTDVADTYPGVVFRYTNSTTSYYGVKFSAGAGTNVYWVHYADASSGSTDIDTAVLGNLAANDTVGVTWTGTGTSTVIRIWANPTANAPTSVSSWDGGSDPADISFTTDPASAVNTGEFIGFGDEQQNADTVRIDNLFAGPL